MATQVTNYKCPACDGGLKFVGSSGMLECEYCGSTFDVAEMEAKYADKAAEAAEAFAEAEESDAEECEWDTSEMEQWGADEGMKAYNCPMCGAQIFCDETTAATACPYCGNPAVVPGQFTGGLKPNYIIPFKLDQKAAEMALANHYKGKKLLPDSFASENRIKELKGVYVPFWFFDGAAEVDMLFDAKNFRTYRSGDYRISETHHFAVRRAGTIPFTKIPVDASSKMPDAYMDAIEPFDYSAFTAFSTAYLPGFLADRYDVSSEDSAKRADERVVNSAVAIVRSDVKGYDSVAVKNQRVRLKRAKVHYGLLPVYMLGTMWEGQNYLFAMNGQTGKLIGDLPIDKKKYWKTFFTIAGIVTAALGTVLMFIL